MRLSEQIANQLIEDLGEKMKPEVFDPESGLNWVAYVRLQIMPLLAAALPAKDAADAPSWLGVEEAYGWASGYDAARRDVLGLS